VSSFEKAIKTQTHTWRIDPAKTERKMTNHKPRKEASEKNNPANTSFWGFQPLEL